MNHGVQKDRGWAWMVVMGAFLVNMLVVGVAAKSFGILFKYLKDHLEHSSSATLFIVAISQCLAMVLGPFANMLVMHFTSRWVVFTGGLIITLGFILSMFAKTIYQLYFTYGLLVGIGSALAYAPSIVTTMQYFDKHKALANGIAVAGGGIGNFAAPPFMQLLLDHYNLRGAFLILAALMLHVCLSGALFRPMTFYSQCRDKQKSEHTELQDNSKQIVQLQEDDKEIVESKPDTCESLCHIDDSKAADSVQLLQKDADSVVTPTGEQAESPGGANKGCLRETTGPCLDEGYGTSTEKSDVTVPSDCQESPQPGYPETRSQKRKSSVQESHAANSTKDPWHKRLHACCCTVPARGPHGQPRPVFEWQLLKNTVFLIYGFSMFFAFSGYPNVFMIILSHAKQKSIETRKATFLVSIVGIFDVVGRIGFGWFSDLNLIQKKHGFLITMAIAGLACIFMPLAGESYVGLSVLCSIFGLFAGSFYALLPAILVEGLGEKKLPSAFGLVTLFMGTAFIYATFIVGWLNDLTGEWEVSFYFSGSVMVVGSMLVLLEPLAVRYELRKAAARQQKVSEGATADTADPATT